MPAVFKSGSVHLYDRSDGESSEALRSPGHAWMETTVPARWSDPTGLLAVFWRPHYLAYAPMAKRAIQQTP